MVTQPIKLLTVKQAAKELGISKCSVYRWVKRRWLTSWRLPNGTIRIPQRSIDDMLIFHGKVK